MSKKMYIFIINPVAGSGQGAKVWKAIKTDLEANQIIYRSFFTKHAGHAEDIAIQVAELHGDKIEAIIVIGGDGTIHEAVNGLRGYPHLPVGYIPGGSGNDFARGLQIPRSPRKAWARIASNRRPAARKIDLGRFGFPERKKAERYFVNGLSIGFDADVAHATNEAKYKIWLNKFKIGGLAYVISVFRLLFSYQPCQMVVSVDGQVHTFEEAWLVAVSNVPFYGGGIKISPKAKPTDGRLNLCIVHQLSRWKLLAVFGTVFLGQHHRFKEVTLLEGSKISIASERPLLIQADGEIIGSTPITVQVENKTQIVI